MGRFAIDFARHVLVYGDGQNEFARLVTGFDVLFEEGHFLELTFFKNLVGHVVERKGELGIFVNAVVVVALKVTLLFSGNHLLHQFDGRVVFA